MKINLLSVAFLSILTVGCASVEYQSPPPLTSNIVTHEISSSELLSQTSNTIKHLNKEKDIIYFQNFGGGGAGVGLLLGPLGVLANAAAIESNTKEDVELLEGKLNLDPKNMFKASLATHQLTVSINAQDSIKLSPYFYVSKTDDEQLLFASALFVETSPGTKSNWLGKYMVQTNVKMALTEVSNGLDAQEYALLNSELQTALDEALGLYIQDREGKLASEKPVKFVSDFLSPRHKFESMGDLIPSAESRINIRTVGGVYSLPKDAVKVK